MILINGHYEEEQDKLLISAKLKGLTKTENETNEQNPADLGKLERPDLMRVTSKLITHLDKKTVAGRFTNLDIERMRDSKIRLLIEAAKVHGSLLRDEILESIEARLKALESNLHKDEMNEIILHLVDFREDRAGKLSEEIRIRYPS
jgi:hypothetical protein